MRLPLVLAWDALGALLGLLLFVAHGRDEGRPFY